MPWFKANGEVGGYYSAKDYGDHKKSMLILMALLVFGVILAILTFFNSLDWQSVGSATTGILKMGSAIAVVVMLVYTVGYSAVVLVREYAEPHQWVGYGVRTLAFVLAVLTLIGLVYGGTDDGLRRLGENAAILGVLWVVIGGIVGIFIRGFVTLIPAIVGFVLLIATSMLTSQVGDTQSPLLGSVIIATAMLNVIWTQRLHSEL